MRILYHSAAPWIQSGYGECTEEIAPRLHNEGHEVAIQSMTAVQSRPIWWHGDELDYDLDRRMRIYPGDPEFGSRQVEDSYEDFNADFYFTHFDSWMKPARNIIPELGVPYSTYSIVDHYPCPDEVVNQVVNAHEVIAMSEYGKQALEAKGIRPIIIPHGVDTDTYKPTSEDKKIVVTRDTGEIQKEETLDIEDTFIVGMNAANFGDRKAIPIHMEAFKRFIEEVDEDAVLFLHTAPTSSRGYNLRRIQEYIGIPDDNLIFTSDELYRNLTDEDLNRYYNCFDILVNCSYGESWGLAITEAQATETPCIITDFSSMPEQLGGELDDMLFEGEHGGWGGYPHGLAVIPSVGLWREKVNTKQYVCHPDDIFAAMSYYYNNPDLIEEHGEKAREFVKNNYSWKDNVIPKFLDHFDRMEELVT